MKKINILFLLVLVGIISVIPNISAVTLDNGLILNTTISNSSVSVVNIVVTTPQVIVENNGVVIHNASYINGPLTVNLTTPINYSTINTDIKTNAFPWMAQNIFTANRRTETIHIGSNLTAGNQVNGTISFIADSCSISSLLVTPNGLAQYTPVYSCNNLTGRITINNTVLMPSANSNEILISYQNAIASSNLCPTIFQGYSSFFNNSILFFTILGIVLVVGAVVGIAYISNRGFDFSNAPDFGFDGMNLDTVKVAFFLMGVLGLIAVIAIVAINSVCSVGV